MLFNYQNCPYTKYSRHKLIVKNFQLLNHWLRSLKIQWFFFKGTSLQFKSNFLILLSKRFNKDISKPWPKKHCHRSSYKQDNGVTTFCYLIALSPHLKSTNLLIYISYRTQLLLNKLCSKMQLFFLNLKSTKWILNFFAQMFR